MDEIFESERLERELNDPASVDPRVSAARRVTRMAATDGFSRRDLLAEARARATDQPAVLFGMAARRTALVASVVLMLGGTTVAVAAHDAEPGSLLHPIRQVGHAVMTFVTGGTETPSDETTADPSTTPTEQPTADPTPTGTPSDDEPDDETGDEDENRGHGNDEDGDDADNPGRGHGRDGDDDDDAAEDENRGHGNDEDGDDADNPGRGHGRGGTDDRGGSDDEPDDEPDDGSDDDASGDDSDGSGNPGGGDSEDDDDAHGTDD